MYDHQWFGKNTSMLFLEETWFYFVTKNNLRQSWTKIKTSNVPNITLKSQKQNMILIKNAHNIFYCWSPIDSFFVGNAHLWCFHFCPQYVAKCSWLCLRLRDTENYFLCISGSDRKCINFIEWNKILVIL